MSKGVFLSKSDQDPDAANSDVAAKASLDLCQFVGLGNVGNGPGLELAGIFYEVVKAIPALAVVTGRLESIVSQWVLGLFCR
jgi:hypothetical protein